MIELKYFVHGGNTFTFNAYNNTHSKIVVIKRFSINIYLLTFNKVGITKYPKNFMFLLSESKAVSSFPMR